MNASSAQRRETDRLVLRLAWPCVLENLSVILISLADAAMIGVLGPAATAAVGVNSSPSWLVSGVVQALGVGGTALAALKLAKRVCRLPETSNSITIGQLDRVCQELCASQKQAADLILKIEPERIHTMIPGMLILRHMVQGFGAGRVIVSQYGVREGYLCQKILKAS